MNAPRRAMVLAAGLGLRMRAADATRPKPLVPLAGKPLIVYALAALEQAGVDEIVVNTHYRAAQLEAFLADYAARPEAPTIHLSREETLLDTGGGVRRALHRFQDAPFYVLNSDTILTGDPAAALRRLRAAWDERAMDALLLLCPIDRVQGYDGKGDFLLDRDGKLARRTQTHAAPFVFTGVQCLHPRLFDGAPDGPYSLNRHYDEAIARGRLYGIAHEGGMLHAGSPKGLAAGERHFATEEERR